MGLAEKVDKALDYAVTGYEIAGGVGAVAGASLGLLIGDETTVLPIDMIAIPAYQAYMLKAPLQSPFTLRQERASFPQVGMLLM